MVRRSPLMRWLFNRENALAFGLCLVIIIVFIATADTAPPWIYQGF